MEYKALVSYGLMIYGILHIIGSAFMVFRLLASDDSEDILRVKPIYDMIIFGLLLLYELVVLIIAFVTRCL